MEHAHDHPGPQDCEALAMQKSIVRWKVLNYLHFNASRMELGGWIMINADLLDNVAKVHNETSENSFMNDTLG